MIKNKKILITGASGFIGSHLVKSLITHNKILGVDRNPSLLVNKKYFHIQKDFRESDFFDSLNSCNMGIEIVIHLAAVSLKGTKVADSIEMKEINSLFTTKLLAWSKEHFVERFIFGSSGAVYGFSDNLLHESSNLNIDNDYSRSKYLGESSVKEYSKYFKCYILRIFYPYGPYMKSDLLMYRLISKIYFEKSVTLNLNGQPKINPVYIGDLIKAIIAILDESEKKEYIYNISGDEILSIEDICEKISNNLEKEYTFDSSDKHFSDMIGSNEKIKDIIGWHPKVHIDVGLNQTITWFKKTILRI